MTTPAWHQEARKLFSRGVRPLDAAEQLNLSVDAVNLAYNRIRRDDYKDKALQNAQRLFHPGYRRRPITLPALKCLSDQNKA